MRVMQKAVLATLSIATGLGHELQPMPKDKSADVEDFLGRHQEFADRKSGTAALPTGHKCRRSRPLELYLLQDGTASFRNLLTGVQKFMPRIIDELSADFQDLKGGITTFADKPFPYDFDTPCYRQDLPMTSDIHALRDACANLSFLGFTTIYDGYDENSIETLAFAAGSHAGFSKPSERSDAIRIAIVITDTFGRLMTRPPGPANPNLANELICKIGADAPPASQVADILRDAQVYPLAIITEHFTPHLIDWWNMVFFDEKYMHLPSDSALVVPFEMEAESMAQAIVAGVRALHCQVEEQATSPSAPPVSDITSGVMTVDTEGTENPSRLVQHTGDPSVLRTEVSGPPVFRTPTQAKFGAKRTDQILSHDESSTSEGQSGPRTTHSTSMSTEEFDTTYLEEEISSTFSWPTTFEPPVTSDLSSPSHPTATTAMVRMTGSAKLRSEFSPMSTFASITISTTGTTEAITSDADWSLSSEVWITSGEVTATSADVTCDPSKLWTDDKATSSSVDALSNDQDTSEEASHRIDHLSDATHVTNVPSPSLVPETFDSAVSEEPPCPTICGELGYAQANWRDKNCHDERSCCCDKPLLIIRLSERPKALQIDITNH